MTKKSRYLKKQNGEDIDPLEPMNSAEIASARLADDKKTYREAIVELRSRMEHRQADNLEYYEARKIQVPVYNEDIYEWLDNPNEIFENKDKEQAWHEFIVALDKYLKKYKIDFGEEK